MSRESFHPYLSTGSEKIIDGKCIIHGVVLGCDAVNDPTITLYNDGAIDATKMILPTQAYDASVLGLNGATNLDIYADKPFVGISCSGTVYVVTYAVTWH